eukprot:8382417-Pyramimonas_sp.AAC.1
MGPRRSRDALDVPAVVKEAEPRILPLIGHSAPYRFVALVIVVHGGPPVLLDVSPCGTLEPILIQN